MAFQALGLIEGPLVVGFGPEDHRIGMGTMREYGYNGQQYSHYSRQYANEFPFGIAAPS